jgi:acetyltransferase-like isoleucine patch superfamily enzyme
MKNWIAWLRGGAYRFRHNVLGRRNRIGAGLRAYGRLDIRGPGRVVIGPDVVVASTPGMACEFVTLYTHAPEAFIRIGKNTRLLGARISARHGIEVGDDVVIEGAGVADSDFHSLELSRGLPTEESLSRSGVIIGAHAAIGCGAMVTKGVRVGSGAVIAPGAVVTRTIPDGAIAVGNPARVMGAIDGCQG